jgi:nucleolar protein 14
MLQKVQVALNRLMRSLKTFGKKDGAVYDGILKMCETMHNEICETKKSSVRLSLAWHTKSVEAIKQFNPMYEEDGFQKGRDYDPNRERAENRKLKKELRKEARGTVRELRKDNQFMHHAREQEKAAEAEERDAKHKEVLSFLEKQESDFKSGGQGGLIVKNKRRAQGGASKNGNRRRF